MDVLERLTDRRMVRGVPGVRGLHQLVIEASRVGARIEVAAGARVFAVPEDADLRRLVRTTTIQELHAVRVLAPGVATRLRTHEAGPAGHDHSDLQVEHRESIVVARRCPRASPRRRARATRSDGESTP